MPSTSRKQQKFMAAVAHNPKFAKKVGVPQSVGQDFHAADTTAAGHLRKLKSKYGDGGKVSALKASMGQIKKLIDQHHAAIGMEDSAQATRVGRQLDAVQPGLAKKSLNMLNSGQNSEDYGRNMKLSTFAEGGKVSGLKTSMPTFGKGGEVNKVLEKIFQTGDLVKDSAGNKYKVSYVWEPDQTIRAFDSDGNHVSLNVSDVTLARRAKGSFTKYNAGGKVEHQYGEGGKVGAIQGLTRMMAKYGAERGGGGTRGPLFKDLYGQEYHSPNELVQGIKNAIEQESDEPRWDDAIGMAKALKNDAAVQAIAQAKSAYDNPQVGHEQLGPLLRAIQTALATPTLRKGKGGMVKSALAKLRAAASMSDDEIAGELRELENNPQTPGGIDRRGAVYDPSSDPNSPRRRYQDLLNEIVRRRGTAVKTPQFGKGGAVGKILKTLRHQVVSATGDDPIFSLHDDLKDAGIAPKSVKVKKQKLVDRSKDEDFHDLELESDPDTLAKFKEWQKSEGLSIGGAVKFGKGGAVGKALAATKKAIGSAKDSTPEKTHVVYYRVPGERYTGSYYISAKNKSDALQKAREAENGVIFNSARALDEYDEDAPNLKPGEMVHREEGT